MNIYSLPSKRAALAFFAGIIFTICLPGYSLSNSQDSAKTTITSDESPGFNMSSQLPKANMSSAYDIDHPMIIGVRIDRNIFRMSPDLSFGELWYEVDPWKSLPVAGLLYSYNDIRKMGIDHEEAADLLQFTPELRIKLLWETEDVVTTELDDVQISVFWSSGLREDSGVCPYYPRGNPSSYYIAERRAVAFAAQIQIAVLNHIRDYGVESTDVEQVMDNILDEYYSNHDAIDYAGFIEVGGEKYYTGLPAIYYDEEFIIAGIVVL